LLLVVVVGVVVVVEVVVVVDDVGGNEVETGVDKVRGGSVVVDCVKGEDVGLLLLLLLFGGIDDKNNVCIIDGYFFVIFGLDSFGLNIEVVILLHGNVLFDDDIIECLIFLFKTND
jgi:hypothetical protein